MLKRILSYLLILSSWHCSAQTSGQTISSFTDDVKIYGNAIKKILKQNDPDGGIRDLTALINRCEKSENYSPSMLATFYRGRAHGFLSKKDYLISIDDYKKAISLLLQAGEEGKSNLSVTWYQLSLAYYYLGNQNETLDAANKCIDAAEMYFGHFHSTTLDAYSLRSNYLAIYNNGLRALQDQKQCFQIIQNNVERNFTYLTSQERSAYWAKYLPQTTTMFAFAQKLNENQSEFTDMLFDQQLLAKGVLLSTESALQRAIDSDPNLSSAYQQIRNLREKASNSATNLKDAEAAILEADRVERDLGTSANSLYQFTNFLRVHTAEVKKSLNKDDIAIEFADYRIGKDSVMYAALVLSPKLRNVIFIPLIEKKEIQIHKDNLAEYIWEPILDVIGFSPKNIYFAPTGLLYQIPIESHQLSDGRYLCDTFNIYRISSTRWLAYSNKTKNGRKAIIYGGLQYDLSVDDMVADSKNYKDIKRSVNLDDEIFDRGVITSLSYLPGTLEEAQTIFSTFKNTRNSFTPTLYTDKQGTESSLKSAGDKDVGILHIATHGFFSSKSPDPMTGCGLCFAGANNKYLRINLPKDTDDGILTAQEISEIDFQGLDLAVLSACQSGLGNISADGIQGLQRGFKKAGCNTIIMSLWNVDDKATQILMTSFYNNYLSGQSKLKAFEKAKRELRDHPLYKSPKYWSAFIILDALQ